MTRILFLCRNTATTYKNVISPYSRAARLKQTYSPARFLTLSLNLNPNALSKIRTCSRSNALRRKKAKVSQCETNILLPSGNLGIFLQHALSNDSSVFRTKCSTAAAASSLMGTQYSCILFSTAWVSHDFLGIEVLRLKINPAQTEVHYCTLRIKLLDLIHCTIIVFEHLIFCWKLEVCSSLLPEYRRVIMRAEFVRVRRSSSCCCTSITRHDYS